MESSSSSKTYIVEHLDPELGPWSTLEYAAIAHESAAAGSKFILSSVPESLKLPSTLQSLPSLHLDHRGVEEIYSNDKSRVCLLDPAAGEELSPHDVETFDVFLFGGILGDDPPRDRTSELRKKGFTGRRLGPVQMTTDTAVRVTRCVIHEQIPLDKIPYIDHPELVINKHESTQMPFRYIRDEKGKPVMPRGMMELIKKDSEKGFQDLL
ncbi:MAG: hypothetical protein GOMPHAMPRED_003444 [Gomphillus americanus]|uniref:DUF431-domain-containing protein n=1 Tax=Gomphillus americanus TaxID=1940652 RepID=A0A8H3FKX4_9LECA|nr:MAG: hypothetical protein GOMPHAMPRED_003444 [Gomphillus americanus]